IVGEATQQLYPLGSGMQRDVEFWIKPLGGNEASYVFEVIYDDDEGTGHFYPTSGRLRFFVVGDEYRPIPTSPYVMGPPVKTQHMFYGRRDVFDWIAENVSGVEQENILILHGERRMGKTSILYQLLERPPSPEYICVFFSLELAVTTSLGDLFYDMATAIQEELARHGVHVLEPSEPEFLRHTQRAFRRFLDTVEAGLGERRLLVMIDEIDILIAKVEEQVLSADAFHLMRGIMQHSAKVAFIVTGAYRAREMLKDNKSILFNIARSYKISYLNEKEAEALIVEPVAEYLTYDNMVVNKILRVTACHPYFVQYICDSLVKLAQRMRKNWVYLPDIEVVLQEVIQDNTGVLQNAVYAPLSKPEQKVLAALANVTDDRTIYVPPEVGAELLDKHGLEVEKTQLLAALRALCERDLVDEKRMGQSLQYGFRMDLIRMWLRQNETLLRLSQEARI
ncbi:MAG: ATP-binding protein, partial [Chloroflexi bacterium]|nr:ATP-binding protein [Chloroflexota bacterium]